jgi:DNA topoisomerase IA
MAFHDKLLMDFLKAQTTTPTPVAAKQRIKASSKIMDPSVHAKPELSMEYICEKKPKGKKVLKFLQQEIDAIMAEAEA